MNDTTIEVLKWVGLAFAAGFVGYFGRHLAKLIIARTRRNKAEPTAPPPDAQSASSTDAVTEAQVKIEKKRAKAEAKRAKKEKG